MKQARHPYLSMSKTEYICLSAAIMMLTALGIDIMLPALGALRIHFGLRPDSTATANIIVFFFMGQVAQLVFGILSDRFGRLRVLRIGFPLYILGGVAAAYAPTLLLMCAARFIAGVGASAVFTTTIAGVRDRFAGDQMARTLSLIFTIFLFTPIAAPFVGIALLSAASWRVVFLTPPLFGLLVFFWSFRLTESHPAEKRTRLRAISIQQALRQVIGNRTFMRYTTITTLLFSGLSVYVSGSERMVGELYGRPGLFAWIFAAIGLVMSLSALFNARLAAKYGAAKSVRYLLLAYTVVSALLLMITCIDGDPPGMFVFFTCIGALMAINLAIEPNSSALALEPLGETAGIAASVYGTIFFFAGSLIGALIGQLMVHSVMPLVISFFLFGITGTALAWGDGGRRNH
ncbi:MFS transporter [Sediminibacterium soli]|uniref:MFS transporter n=1 Tax=Sediminibacterium soli TaxID=2698829 RepID=UPI001F47E9EA|nr:MFS transporter [Sediminibacterium soli]